MNILIEREEYGMQLEAILPTLPITLTTFPEIGDRIWYDTRNVKAHL